MARGQGRRALGPSAFFYLAIALQPSVDFGFDGARQTRPGLGNADGGSIPFSRM